MNNIHCNKELCGLDEIRERYDLVSLLRSLRYHSAILCFLADLWHGMLLTEPFTEMCTYTQGPTSPRIICSKDEWLFHCFLESDRGLKRVVHDLIRARHARASDPLIGARTFEAPQGAGRRTLRIQGEVIEIGSGATIVANTCHSEDARVVNSLSSVSSVASLATVGLTSPTTRPFMCL